MGVVETSVAVERPVTSRLRKAYERWWGSDDRVILTIVGLPVLLWIFS